MVDWPLTLPQRPLARGFSYLPRGNIVQHQPEYSLPLERSRDSTEAVDMVAAFRLTTAQATIAFTLWRNNLLYGTVPVNFPDPIQGDTVPFLMRRPRFTAISGNRFLATVSMVRLP
jgi:hypothetical protein